LHFETHSGGRALDPAKYLAGAIIPEGIGDSGGGLLETLVSPLRNFIDGIGEMVSDAMGGSPFVELLVGGATGIGHNVIDWAIDKVLSIGDFFSGGDSGAGTAGGVAGAAAAKQQVKGVAAQYGWDSGSQWNALEELVQRESSWNVNAANPNSSARGLFQKMTSLHGAVEGSAAGQAQWGLPYIQRTYGTPSLALAHHNVRGWYADGGLVRDRGGVIPPGSSVVHNWTRDPEWMYTNKQQDTVQDALDIAKNGAGKQLHVHLNGDGISVGDVFRKFEFEERREMRKAGV